MTTEHLGRDDPDALRIREAARADLGAVSGIYNHFVLRSTCTYETEPETAAERERWFAEHEAGRFPILVAERRGEIVGWGALSCFRPRHGYRFTVEDSVYVREDQHRRGVGRAILAELLRRAADLGFRTVIAGVSSDQGPSLVLHERLGFVRVGRFREVGRKFDRWLDVVWLQRML